jgi:hypothetical protein
VGTKRAIFPGLARWDNIKLAEVWAEYKWHLAQKGVWSVADLSEADRAVFELLVRELKRRGMNLSEPYGKASR